MYSPPSLVSGRGVGADEIPGVAALVPTPWGAPQTPEGV